MMSWRQPQLLVWQKMGIAGHSSNVFFNYLGLFNTVAGHVPAVHDFVDA